MDAYHDLHGLETPHLGAQSSSSTVAPQSQGYTTTSAAPSASSTQLAPASTRVRRRNRMITSCLECRRRKLKCDKSHPCVNCTKGHRDCVFLAPALDQASQLKLTEIKEKVGSLERLLERDVGRASVSAAPLSHTEPVLPDDADDDLPGAEDERELMVTPLAVIDAAYDDDDDADADDDMLDLGIQIGKMRLSERVGGFFRPRIAEELSFSFSHPSKDKVIQAQHTDPGSQLPPGQSSFDYLRPGPDYIAPTSGFFFGQGNNQASLIDFLPSRLAADRLIKQYFSAVHPIATIVHRPSFEKEYESFWHQVSLGIEPPASVQTVVFAAMFSGIVSMDETVIIRDFGVSKESLIENFKIGTETALARAHFLRTTKVETLQAFIMYLIPVCRSEMSRAHSVLLGAAIRMAECTGLHRDGETYGLNPLETHVRRLIWGQICFLDLRTCESQGPRPTIRRDDFDTKLPLNINEVDIHASGPPPLTADRWTDTTFTIMRFELNEMMRVIWVDRPRVERREISLTALLSKIETFRRNFAIKYDHLIDERIPFHRYAQLTKNLFLAKLHVMVLHRYHISVSYKMPPRLRQMLITACTVNLESAVAMDTVPEISMWKWYAGAYHQYHTAFLLLIDVHYFHKTKEIDRIWACLDYVFETHESDDSRDLKARKILKEMHERTAAYQAKRRMRAPSAMLKHIGVRPPRQVTGSTSVAKPPERDDVDPFPSDSSDMIGRANVPFAYAGTSNGEMLWALPPGGSPTSNQEGSNSGSDPGTTRGQIMPQMQKNPPKPPGDDLMPDIDWDAFDALFPPDQNGEMIIPNFNPMNPAVY